MATQSELRGRPAKLEGEELPRLNDGSDGRTAGAACGAHARLRRVLLVVALGLSGLTLLLLGYKIKFINDSTRGDVHLAARLRDPDDPSWSSQPIETPPDKEASADATSPTPSSTPQESQGESEQCYFERDLGLIEKAATPSHVFCASPHATTTPSTKRTKVSLFDAPSGIQPVVFENLLLDLTNAKPNHDITSIAEDGGNHDPRFNFTRDMIYCACDELQDYVASYKAKNNRTLLLWELTLAYPTQEDQSDVSLVCGGANANRPAVDDVVEYPGRVLLIVRRDDHNPFFQVSNALNAWIMLRALKWDPKDLTLIHLDAGYPSPVDALHQKLLAPGSEIQRGRELMGKRLLFSGEVMLAPFEILGPMMRHLDDEEPCFASELFRIFRSEALHVMGVKEKQAPASSRKEFTVTFISRKPYAGRVVQRRWINEDEVVARLRAEYPAFDGRAIVFRSIDFVDLTLQTQMQLMVESDVVVSMHGAGLVNVMWARPGTLVVEIFPKPRRRWGYRNLCQFLGCDWHEFRGGEDIRTGTDGHPNANDKVIPYEEWKAFFEPLLRHQLSRSPTTE